MFSFAPVAFLRRLAATGGSATLAARNFTVLSRRFSYVKDNRGYEHFQSSDSGVWNTKTYAWLLGGTVVAGGVTYYRAREEVPYTHRWHAVFVSPQLELELGRKHYAEIKEAARAQGKLVPDTAPAAVLVRRVGRRIQLVATDGYGGGSFQHLKNAEWEFTVIDSPEANAFVVPGGKVVVYSGLLHLLKTEDELAAVVAHEAAHVLARHQGERMSQAGAFTLAQVLVWTLLGINIPTAAAQLGMFLPNSRKAEMEADAIGIRLMARACYNPHAAISMLQKLHGLEVRQGAQVPSILRTHPLSEERVAAARRGLPEAMRLLEGTDCGQDAFQFLQGLAAIFK